MNWLINSWESTLLLLWSHILLTLPVIVLSTVIAVPIGRLASAHRSGNIILTICGLLYAVPALPLLIVVPIVTGLPLRSPANVIFALTLYAMALLVRTVADSFAAIDPAVVESASAQGHSRLQLALRVEFPLAVPVIISGLRVISASTIGLVTIGALIGVPGLGSLFTDGFQRGIVLEVLVGIVLTAALAMVFDAGLRLTQRLLCPWQAAAREETKGLADGPATIPPNLGGAYVR